MSDMLIARVKRLRLELSEVIVLTERLKMSLECGIGGARMHESFMCLGKVLGLLGEPYPYPQDNEQGVSTIVPDFIDRKDVYNADGDYISQVKHARDMMQKVITSSIWNDLFEAAKDREVMILMVRESLASAMIGKMWLGRELLRETVDAGQRAEARVKAKEDIERKA